MNFHKFTTDEKNISNGASSELRDSRMQVPGASTFTPTIQDKSTLKAEVCVVANVSGVEFVILSTPKALPAEEHMSLLGRCPTDMYFAVGKKTNGLLFAEVMGKTREKFIRRCNDQAFCEEFGVDPEALQCVPLMLLCDAPTFHKTDEVHTAACMCELSLMHTPIDTHIYVGKHNINVIALLAHTSIWAQALDDVVFSRWQEQHGKRVQEYYRLHGRRPNRLETLEMFFDVQAKYIDSKSVEAAHRRTGVAPWTEWALPMSAFRHGRRLGYTASMYGLTPAQEKEALSRCQPAASAPVGEEMDKAKGVDESPLNVAPEPAAVGGTAMTALQEENCGLKAELAWYRSKELVRAEQRAAKGGDGVGVAGEGTVERSGRADTGVERGADGEEGERAQEMAEREAEEDGEDMEIETAGEGGGARATTREEGEEKGAEGEVGEAMATEREERGEGDGERAAVREERGEEAPTSGDLADSNTLVSRWIDILSYAATSLEGTDLAEKPTLALAGAFARVAHQLYASTGQCTQARILLAGAQAEVRRERGEQQKEDLARREQRRQEMVQRARDMAKDTKVDLWRKFLNIAQHGLPFSLDMWDVHRTEVSEEGLSLLTSRLAEIEQNWKRVEGEIKERKKLACAGPRLVACYELKKDVKTLLKEAKARKKVIESAVRERKEEEDKRQRETEKKRKREEVAELKNREREEKRLRKEVEKKEQVQRLINEKNEERLEHWKEDQATQCMGHGCMKWKGDEEEWVGCAAGAPGEICIACRASGATSPTMTCGSCGHCNSWICKRCQEKWTTKNGKANMDGWECGRDWCGKLSTL